MTEWFLDPKSISLIGGTVVTAAVSVWRGKETAAIVADLVKWRLDTVTPALTDHNTRLKTAEDEIHRLRDLREGQ